MNAMPTDPRPVYARATEQAASVIKSVRPEQLTGPTPCTDFDVRTLLSHIVGGTRRIAVVGEGGDGLAESPFSDGVPDDGWPQAYDEVRERVLRAWASEELLESTVRVPWGEVPGWQALSGYVMEIVAHTWDLSEALGRPLELDPALAEFALATGHRALPAEGRGDGEHFGAVRPAPEGAEPYGRLAAWLGRKPLTRA